jgi:kynurenine formamidase
VAQLERDGYYLRRFSMGEHSSTHLNAPNSFHANGASVDWYSAESLVLPAVVMDVCAQIAGNPDYALLHAAVLAWEHRHGLVSGGSVVLLYTGWQAKWDDPAAYFGQDTRGGLHFPGFSVDAARFLLEERGVAGVGIDTPGVDPGQDSTFPTNRLVLEQPRIVLENLTNLDQLPPVGTTLVIGILPLEGGTGTPASVVAFVP